MHTKEGDLDPSKLHKEILTEQVPCGEAKTTRFFHEGRLVRQDCEILVLSKAPIVERFSPEEPTFREELWLSLKRFAIRLKQRF